VLVSKGQWPQRRRAYSPTGGGLAGRQGGGSPPPTGIGLGDG